jgi:hypothetical protein
MAGGTQSEHEQTLLSPSTRHISGKNYHIDELVETGLLTPIVSGAKRGWEPRHNSNIILITMTYVKTGHEPKKVKNYNFVSFLSKSSHVLSSSLINFRSVSFP